MAENGEAIRTLSVVAAVVVAVVAVLEYVDKRPVRPDADAAAVESALALCGSRASPAGSCEGQRTAPTDGFAEVVVPSGYAVCLSLSTIRFFNESGEEGSEERMVTGTTFRLQSRLKHPVLIRFTIRPLGQCA